MTIIWLKRSMYGVNVGLLLGLLAAAGWYVQYPPLSVAYQPPRWERPSPPPRDHRLLWSLQLRPPRVEIRAPSRREPPLVLPIRLQAVFLGPPASICARVAGRPDQLWWVGRTRKIAGMVVRLAAVDRRGATFAVGQRRVRVER